MKKNSEISETHFSMTILVRRNMKEGQNSSLFADDFASYFIDGVVNFALL